MESTTQIGVLPRLTTLYDLISRVYDLISRILSGGLTDAIAWSADGPFLTWPPLYRGHSFCESLSNSVSVFTAPGAAQSAFKRPGFLQICHARREVEGG